jgi:hypothetical protein
MKIKDIAKDVRELLQGGCGWVVLYKVGRSWEYLDTFCYGNATNNYEWTFDNEEQRQEILDILEADPHAVILSGADVCMTDEKLMSLETLAEELKDAYLLDEHLKLSKYKEDILEAKVTDSVELEDDSPTSFDVGMQFGSVEVSKRTDRMVYLKSLENGLRTKKKVKAFKDGREYIDMDIGTCEWLGIIGDDEFFKHTTVHPD